MTSRAVFIDNDKRNRGVSKDKKLKKIRFQKISRKDFKPTNTHQTSEGGKSNVPTVFPLSKTHQKVNTEPRRTLIRVNTSVKLIPSSLTDPARQ